MPIDRWPFYPECISDVLPEDTIAFAEVASARLLDAPVAIVEVKNGKTRRILPEKKFEEEGWSKFCLRLRNRIEQKEFKNGEKACWHCDALKAQELLNKANSQNAKLIPEAYSCHMGLMDLAAVVYVDIFPVAVLLTGQQLPEDNNAVELIKERVDRLEKPLESGYPQVSASSEAKERLKNEISELKKYETQLHLKLGDAALRIGALADDAYNRIRQMRTVNFISESFEPMTRDQRNPSGLREWLKKLLGKAREFCGARWIALFGHWDEHSNILDVIAADGIPDTYLVEYHEFSVVNLHINWSKAHIPPVKEDLLKWRWRLSKEDVHQGVKHRLGPDVPCLNLIHNAELWLPHIHSGGERTLLAISGLPKETDLEKEKNFLMELSHLIGQRFVHRADYIRRIQMENLAESVASLIAHQVRASLTPIRTGVELARMLLDSAQIPISLKARGILMEVDACIDNLAEQGRITLETLRSKAEYAWQYRREQFRSTDLVALVQGIASELTDKARRRGQHVIVTPGTTAPPELSAVPEAMRTLFLNLFDNALKYSQGSTDILIEFHYDTNLPFFSRRMQVCMKTLGRQIESDELRLVFQRGYQGKHAYNFEGSGLGLWECRNIVLGHGGEITAFCRETRRQAAYEVTFTIDLPIPRRKKA